jgi:hypothetical protein
MGTNCGSHDAPEASNICGEVDQEYKVPKFCSFRDWQKQEVCQSMSPEWTRAVGFGYCYSHGTTDYGFGCCNGTCGSPFGTSLQCGRSKFDGDPLSCCFQDHNCTKSSPGKKDRTCFVGDDMTPSHKTR